MQNHFRCSCLDQLLKVRLPRGVHRLVGLSSCPAGSRADAVTRGTFVLSSVRIAFPRTKLSSFIFCCSNCTPETEKLLTYPDPSHYSEVWEVSEFGLTSACHWAKAWCCVVTRWRCHVADKASVPAWVFPLCVKPLVPSWCSLCLRPHLTLVTFVALPSKTVNIRTLGLLFETRELWRETFKSKHLLVWCFG